MTANTADLNDKYRSMTIEALVAELPLRTHAEFRTPEYTELLRRLNDAESLRRENENLRKRSDILAETVNAYAGSDIANDVVRDHLTIEMMNHITNESKG